MMIDQIRAVRDFFTDILLILRNKRRLPVFVVLADYLRIRLNALIDGTKKEDSFGGWKWHFFDYGQLLAFLSHTFIHNDYFFETKLKKPRIIDCGANIGDTVIYFKSLYPGSLILAFEPDKRTFGLLQKNIEDNHLVGVTYENKAVSDTNQSVKFYRSPQKLGDGTMSLFKERGHKDHITVNAIRLSDYIDGPIDFLKIDTEGAEGKILKDLDKKNKLKFIRKMVVEYHHHIGGQSNRLSDILLRLERNGFQFQLATDLKTPFIEGIFQDVLIYAYR